VAGVFVTGTGTGVGKTWVARGLARGFVRRGVPVAAIKPVETGCTPDALDARVLARACGRPELESAPGLVRYRAAVSPHAATLGGEGSCPTPELLARAVVEAAGDALLVVEGAGGLLTPLDADATIAELAVVLTLPLVVVAPDVLGCLSSVLTLADAARMRKLPIAVVVLTRFGPADASRATNARILEERLGVPVHAMPACGDDDDALADAMASISRTPRDP